MTGLRQDGLNFFQGFVLAAAGLGVVTTVLAALATLVLRLGSETLRSLVPSRLVADSPGWLLVLALLQLAPWMLLYRARFVSRSMEWFMIRLIGAVAVLMLLLVIIS